MIQTNRPPVTRRASARSLHAALLQTAAASAIVVGVIAVVATTRADVDLWGHVRFGMDTLRTGHLDRVDPYSFTSDRPWLNHEWLAELVFALAWQWGGNTGLVAVKLTSIASALWMLRLVLMRAGASARSSIVLLGLALTGILPRVNHVRPQLFSVTLFAALLLIFSHAERRPRRVLWTVPLLALWANLHGGWIVGLATLGAWALGYVWDRRSSGTGPWLMLALCVPAAAATLLTPYGVGLWRFLFETVGFGREAIAEWGPLWSNPPLLLLWSIFAILAVAAIVRGPGPLPAAAITVPAAWGIASLRVSRLDAFFALAVIALLGPRLEWLLRAPPAAPLPLTRHARAAVAAAVTAIALAIPAVRRPLTCVDVYDPWWPEPEAVTLMKSQQLAGRMVTFFRWGEYAIWHVPPSLKVSMDGRRETVYSDRVIRGHLQLYDGTPEGLAFLDGLAADYVWLPRFLPVAALVESRGWEPVFRGPKSVLLARRGSSAPASAAGRFDAGTSPARCFPGP